MKKRGKGRLPFYIITGAILLVECIGTIIFFLPAKTVSLKPIGAWNVDIDQLASIDASWDIVSPEDNAEYDTLYWLQSRYGTDFDGLVLDSHQNSYLVVYGYSNVELSYSLWDLELNNVIPPTSFFFWGHLAHDEEITSGKIFVFQFPKLPISRYGRF